MAQRPTIKVYPTDQQKQKIEAAARRAGLSVSAYLVKAGTQDTLHPKAQAQVRVLTLVERTAQALERIAAVSAAGSDLEAMLLLRRLDAIGVQLDGMTDLIAEARR